MVEIADNVKRNLNEAKDRYLQTMTFYLASTKQQVHEEPWLTELSCRLQSDRCISRSADFLDIVGWKSVRALGHAKKETVHRRLEQLTSEAFELAERDPAAAIELLIWDNLNAKCCS